MAVSQLVTVEQYCSLREREVPTELIAGRIVELGWSLPRHGQVCASVGYFLGDFAVEQGSGHVVLNAGIITERNPDTVRCGDIWFISFEKAPKGPLPDEYLSVPPDIVVEVLSEKERWPNVFAKVAEFLAMGVPVVCVVDPRDETVRLYFDDKPEIVLTGADELTFPNQLPGFSVLVQRLFE